MTLSLEQAVGQRLVLSFVGAEPSPEILAAIGQGRAAGVTLFRAFNVVDPGQVRRLTRALQAAAARAGQPPLLIGADQEGGQLMAIGGATNFPGNLALGAAGSADLAYQAGHALGRELAAIGVNVDYAPSCDVNSNPRNPVIGTRSFGEDPAQVARLGAALAQGLQAAGVAATAKHFPGHGDVASDTHHGAVVVPHDRERLQRVEFPPFAAAIAAGVKLVMSAHIAVPAYDDGRLLPATLSRALLRGVLREELGFQGVIISDAMDMSAIAQGRGLLIDALAAAAAGIDLLLLKEDPLMQQEIYAGLLQAAGRGLLAPSEALASAERVLALKRWLAEQPPPLEVVGAAEHQALAAEIAARSLTLVRDDAKRLPLRLAPEDRVAVIVPQPADLTPADTSSYVTCALADELRRYHPSVDEYVVPHHPSDADIAALRRRAGEYRLAIVATINATAAPGQAALVNALLDTGIPLIAVALRMPYDLEVYPAAPTYVCTYSILPPSMAALARALLGEIAFAGRLPVAIPGLYPLGHGM